MRDPFWDLHLEDMLKEIIPDDLAYDANGREYDIAHVCYETPYFTQLEMMDMTNKAHWVALDGSILRPEYRTQNKS